MCLTIRGLLSAQTVKLLIVTFYDEVTGLSLVHVSEVQRNKPRRVMSLEM
jgi:hypothetical protein